MPATATHAAACHFCYNHPKYVVLFPNGREIDTCGSIYCIGRLPEVAREERVTDIYSITMRADAASKAYDALQTRLAQLEQENKKLRDEQWARDHCSRCGERHPIHVACDSHDGR